MFILTLQNALQFAIHTIFSAYIMIVLFRFLLQLVRGDFYNPLAQLAVKLTNPILVPLRKVIPSYAKIDFAALVLALILQGTEIYIQLFLKGFLLVPSILSMFGLLIWSVGELLDLLLVFLFFATLIQVIYSWIQPGTYNSGIMVFGKITEPLINPVRRVLPDFGMLDFSPMIVIFLIYLSRMIVATPIIYYGKGLI